MVEEIELIVAALEGVANGAFWVVMSYFGLHFLKAILVAGVVVFIAHRVAGLVRRRLDMSAVSENDWNMYQWDEHGHDSINAIFPSHKFKELLRAIADRSGCVGSYEIDAAIKKIKSK